jgi:nitrogen fixation/metabolism regulation signal transduction histidine kinase
MDNATQESKPLGFFEKLGRRKLRNYLFLDRRLQLHFALLLAVVGAFNAAYFSALVYFYTRESFYQLAAYVPEYLLTDDVFRQSYRLFLTTIVFTTVGELVFIVLLGLFFSHRIAGPLYAMSQRLQAMSRGELPDPVRLRKNDFLVDFADRLNEAIAVLGTQRAEVAAAAEALRAGRTSECEERLGRLTAPAPRPEPASPHAGPPPASA